MAQTINLTLDALKIPGIESITESFGDKVLSGTGLSTTQVHENVFMGFKKQRATIITDTDVSFVTKEAESSELRTIQYNATLCFSVVDDTPVSLELASGGFEGCRLTILNKNTVSHNISFSTSTWEVTGGNSLELIWDGSTWAEAHGKVRTIVPSSPQNGDIWVATN